VAACPPRAIFSCVPSKAMVPLALCQLWLRQSWQILRRAWVVSFLPLPPQPASPGPSPVLGTSQVMLSPSGRREPGGSPRRGRGGLGQSPAEGSRPQAGGQAGSTSLWASACRVATSVAGMEPVLAPLWLPAALAGACQPEKLWLG